MRRQAETVLSNNFVLLLCQYRRPVVLPTQVQTGPLHTHLTVELAQELVDDSGLGSARPTDQ